MSNINTAFCRQMATNIQAVVKKHFPEINLRKDSGVVGKPGDWYTFEVVQTEGENFVWQGKCDNAYHARYEGWYAFLRDRGIPGYADN